MSSDSACVLIAGSSSVQTAQLRRGLESSGYRVIEAHDGESALALVLEDRPSLVLSDLDLPRMNGYELCRAIRSITDLNAIPVILLTESSEPRDVIRGLGAGADGYLTMHCAQRAVEFLNNAVEQRVAAKTERILRQNRVYAMHSAVNATIGRIGNRHELFEEACRIAVDVGGFALAWIANVDAHGAIAGATAWAGDGPRSFFDVLVRAISDGIGSIERNRQAMLAGTPLMWTDLSADGDQMLHSELAKHAVRSLVAIPLMQGNRVVALLSLCARESGFFDAEEMVLLRGLASDLYFALDYLEKTP